MVSSHRSFEKNVTCNRQFPTCTCGIRKRHRRLADGVLLVNPKRSGTIIIDCEGINVINGLMNDQTSWGVILEFEFYFSKPSIPQWYLRLSLSEKNHCEENISLTLTSTVGWLCLTRGGFHIDLWCWAENCNRKCAIIDRNTPLRKNVQQYLPSIGWVCWQSIWLCPYW